MRSPSIVLRVVMIIEILLNTDNNVYTTNYAHALKRKSKFKHKMKLLKTTYSIKQERKPKLCAQVCVGEGE